MNRTLLLSLVVSMAACVAADDEAEVAQASTFTRHLVFPHETDFGKLCQNNDAGAIGCESKWGDMANDARHVLYPGSTSPESKLLVYLPGHNNEPDAAMPVSFYETAVEQGYHVIALSYKNQEKHVSQCGTDSECWGAYMQEVIDGTNCPSTLCPASFGLDINNHKQDSIIRRLESVLAWADAQFPNEGWDRYLATDGHVRWGLVTMAGFSLGSGFAAKIGMDNPVRRVAMLAGPNDSPTGDPADHQPAAWIEYTSKNDRFFGLIHTRNATSWVLTSDAWLTFGMEGMHFYDPDPDTSTSFGSRQLIISSDSRTTDDEAHCSVIRGEYLDCNPTSANDFCRIGYRQAWIHVIGTGM